VPLSDDLARAAGAAAAHADAAETLEAVLAAEPSAGLRFYVCSFTGGSEPPTRTWLVLDAEGAPVTRRDAVRDAVSVAALAEIAADTAGGGDLEALRRDLAELRANGDTVDVDEAEDAAAALEAAIGAAPRLASPAYLDDVGLATRRLEQALGGGDSPFAKAMAAARAAVDALTEEVETGYKAELT
jgi:hypothetical protein